MRNLLHQTTKNYLQKERLDIEIIQRIIEREEVGNETLLIIAEDERTPDDLIELILIKDNLSHAILKQIYSKIVVNDKVSNETLLSIVSDERMPQSVLELILTRDDLSDEIKEKVFLHEKFVNQVSFYQYATDPLVDYYVLEAIAKKEKVSDKILLEVIKNKNCSLIVVRSIFGRKHLTADLVHEAMAMKKDNYQLEFFFEVEVANNKRTEDPYSIKKDFPRLPESA